MKLLPSNCKRREWTEDEDNLLRDLDGKTPLDDVAKLIGCSLSTLTKRKKALGLYKFRTLTANPYLAKSRAEAYTVILTGTPRPRYRLCLIPNSKVPPAPQTEKHQTLSNEQSWKD